MLGAPRTAGFRFCCPVRTEPRLSLVTSSVRTQLRGNRERLVIVGTCRFERFNGSFRPGKNTTFEYTSILVRPRQEPRFRAFWWSRRVPPPGPLHLFRGIIYRHSRQAGTADIGAVAADLKGGSFVIPAEARISGGGDGCEFANRA